MRHLLGQPLPPIQVDLHLERKPGLDARTHESEHRVHPVVVQKQAFSQLLFHLQLLSPRIRPYIETQARLHATQHTASPGEQNANKC
jgi:hypothetical protein